ncbi:MAG TPA: hypothetical protein VLV49_06030 [Terriglobales bacterium]|nr:hypothetical protein [Terriglobales bacterium]
MAQAAVPRPEIEADLTVTIDKSGNPTFNPPSGEVPAGGVILFKAHPAKRWLIELYQLDGNGIYPLSLFVREHSGVEVCAYPAKVPVNVNFNIVSYPPGQPTLPQGGPYTIKIGSETGN